MYNAYYTKLISEICIKSLNMAEWDNDMRDYLLGMGMWYNSIIATRNHHEKSNWCPNLCGPYRLTLCPLFLPDETMNSPTYLLPAYGRKYTSRTAALADWHAGKDFLCSGSGYCSIRDIAYFKSLGGNIYFKINDTYEKLWYNRGLPLL